jgi:hypothetical protein
MAIDGNAKGKALPLRDLASVNTALSLLYDKEGNYRAGFSPDGFYKTQLLNTLEWGSENHVHQMFATTEILKPGQKAVKYRRYRDLTPNLAPLPEGIPNAPDKLAYEEIEISNLFTFGRWYEFTAEVDWDVVDPVIARATQNLVDVAERTKELYARKMWLSTPNQYFARGKTFDSLTLADAVTLEDLLFITSRMERMRVKPIGGKFNYICSKEFLRGLFHDPIVKQYLEMNNVSPQEFLKALNGEPLDLIDVKFIPTMLDEYAYPDIEYPGVYYDASIDKEVIRYVWDDTKTNFKGNKTGNIYYLDIAEDFQTDVSVTTVLAKSSSGGVTYLQDGSAIDNKITWELPMVSGLITSAKMVTDAIASKKALIKVAAVSEGVHQEPAVMLTSDTSGIAKVDSAVHLGKFTQLPVHRGILFGDEALVKIVHANRNDGAELIIHKPGEAGALDPYNQRQSIAVRVKGFGVGINRTEAIVATFGVPYLAAHAFLEAQYRNWNTGGLLDERGLDGFHGIGADGIQTLPVAGINMAAKPTMTYPKFSKTKPYAAGDMVVYNNAVYVFNQTHTAGAWNKEHVLKVNQPVWTTEEPKESNET